MGQVLIEIPQKVNRSYHVDDSAFGEQLLDELERYSKAGQTLAILPPRRNSLKEDSDNVLGIWADREESAEEIARKIRENNRRVT